MSDCTSPSFCTNILIKGYGQYGMHGSIVNVSTKLNLVQIVLPQLPYDDSSIIVSLKKRKRYKSIYMSGYVCPNMVVKTL
jgi:ArsR family metal-binding transcriptional regulator